MSMSDSVFITLTRASSQSSSTTTFTSASVSATTTAAGRPGISAGSGTCSLNVEEDSSSFGKVVWTNCCLKENPELNCPPQTQKYTTCPAGYLNCADPVGHAEMCSVNSDEFKYSNSKPLNKKCCPKNFSCGLTWTTPCELISGTTNVTFPPYTNPEKVITNPLYLKVSGVFAGCNDANEISPGAVGGLIAVAIIGLCLLSGLIMWCFRRYLYRDPSRQVVHPRAQKVVSDRRGRAKNLEIIVTRDYKIEERGRHNGSQVRFAVQPDPPPNALCIDIGDAARMSRAIQRNTI